MAVKMVLFWFSLVLLIVGSLAAGEFDVIHSPRSLKFSGSSSTPESLLKEIFSASLGLSVEEDAEWDGLSIIDPFTTPEAVVEVHVDGISSLGNAAGVKAHSYPLFVDTFEPDTFESIQHRIQQRFSNGANKLVKIMLTEPTELQYDSNVFGNIKQPKVGKQTLQHLKHSVDEDYQFLAELETLKAITAQVASAVTPDNIIDFFYFRFQSLHPLTDFHGPNSLQVKEAKKLLGEAIEELSKAFVKAYDGSVLFTSVATDVAHTRRTARAAPSMETQRQMTSSGSYSEDYAAVFNIILWFGIVFTFALVSVVYAIMDMDPGRDSIIYRMTNTRIKKDN